MRRAFGLALLTLLALTLLVGPAGAADASVGDEPVVLAVEEDGPIGPEPMDRMEEDNPARELAGFENPDVPFTYGAAFILTFAGLVGVALLGGLYWLLVHRPSRDADGSS